MASTSIEWTDTVWNPVVGCSRVSAGCLNCYAFALHDRRYAANFRAARIWSGILEEGDRRIRNNEGWPQWVKRVGKPPEGWAPRARKLGVRLPLPAQYDRPFSQVQLLPQRLEQPLHWRKPRRVFVNSLSDLFHEDVPDEFIAQVWITMAYSPQHTFQILTKRPERMRAIINPSVGIAGLLQAAGIAWPLPNVWLGVSVEDQKTADERIPLLLQTPAAVRFVSYEPALAPVDFEGWLYGYCPEHDAPGLACNHNQCKSAGKGLDWVIVGGESGPGARPFYVEWARHTIAQCKAANVACFVKQLGSKPRFVSPINCEGTPELLGIDFPLRLKDRKGSSPDEWPEHLRVREFPEVRA